VERERGLTVDSKLAGFATARLDVSLLDTPGCDDYVKNMLGGAAQSEAAVVVVSADAAELDASLAEGGQLREHLLMAGAVGIKQIVVAVTKMDRTR
jgi:elongation factor 1-alpha